MVDRREDLERPDIEGLWLEVSLPKSRRLLTSCLYRPPNSSNHYDKGFCSKMNNTLNTAVSKGQEVVLLGDWNTDFASKRSTIPESNQLKSLFKSLQFTQIIKEPTRVTAESRTMIDLIATNHPQNIKDSGVVTGVKFPHSPLLHYAFSSQIEKTMTKTIHCHWENRFVLQ